MLELFTLGIWLLALSRSVRHRGRFAIATGMSFGYLLLGDTAAALATDAGDQNIWAFFNQALLGPGAAPLRAPGVLPLPGILLRYPLVVRGVRCLLSSLTAGYYLRRAAALHPYLPHTAALESIAMPFVALFVVDGLEATVLLLGWLILGNAMA